jgi:hypothetical protein
MTVSQRLGAAAIRYYGRDASGGNHVEHEPVLSVA